MPATFALGALLESTWRTVSRVYFRKFIGETVAVFASSSETATTLPSVSSMYQYESDERTLARTLTILLQLGPKGKRQPLKLVAQMRLIDKGDPIIKLPHADLLRPT